MKLGLGLSLQDANKPLISVPRTPLVILASSAPKLWLDARLGAGANTWADQSGNGNDMTEPTNPPSKTTLGANPCYVGDGVIQRFRNAAMTVTTGAWYWVIARPITQVNDMSLCGGRTNGYSTIFVTNGPNEVSMFSGTVGAPNSAGVPGAWYRYKWTTSGTGTDYLQIGAIGNKVVGTGGSNAETGWDLFCRAGAHFGNYAIAAVVVCAAPPLPAEQDTLDTEYCAGNFAGVAI